MPRVNAYGQPIGDPIDWSCATVPPGTPLRGGHVRLEPLSPAHAQAVADELGSLPELWTYQPEEPPTDAALAETSIAALRAQPDTVAYAIVEPGSGALLGRACYLRIQPAIGTIEVGAIIYAPRLQRTTAATEVQLLLMRHAFDDLGYRRYEWKCDSLNAPSRAAALRLGFVEEGTWRNALVHKGRTRDTAWFSVTDAEWPAVNAALEAWLDDANHDADGGQRRSLAQLRAEQAAARG